MNKVKFFLLEVVPEAHIVKVGGDEDDGPGHYFVFVLWQNLCSKTKSKNFHFISQGLIYLH